MTVGWPRYVASTAPSPALRANWHVPNTIPGCGCLLGLAAQLIDTWPAPAPGRFLRRHDTDGLRRAYRDALRLLHHLGDEATTRRFLCEDATPHYRGYLPAGA